MLLDLDAATVAVEGLSAELGLDTIRTAWGIHDVVNESMAAATRSHVAERNRDPRNYTLFAFGGAGPVHAVAVARKVGIPEVIVPLGAGVTSALGLLTAPMAVDLVQSAPSPLSRVDWEAVAHVLDDVERRARAILSLDGLAHEALTVERAVDMRYMGQAHEITVQLPVPPTDPGVEGALRRAFDETYLGLYSVLERVVRHRGAELARPRVRAGRRPLVRSGARPQPGRAVGASGVGRAPQRRSWTRRSSGRAAWPPARRTRDR